jgi:exodeoxyribonuclease VII small subunit
LTKRSHAARGLETRFRPAFYAASASKESWMPESPQRPPAADVERLSFEEALGELEQIVRALESGQQKLEDAINAYERGSALRRHCEAKLAEAEARVAAIVQKADGTMTTRPME